MRKKKVTGGPAESGTSLLDAGKSSFRGVSFFTLTPCCDAPDYFLHQQERHRTVASNSD